MWSDASDVTEFWSFWLFSSKITFDDSTYDYSLWCNTLSVRRTWLYFLLEDDTKIIEEFPFLEVNLSYEFNSFSSSCWVRLSMPQNVINAYVTLTGWYIRWMWGNTYVSKRCIYDAHYYSRYNMFQPNHS